MEICNFVWHGFEQCICRPWNLELLFTHCLSTNYHLSSHPNSCTLSRKWNEIWNFKNLMKHMHTLSYHLTISKFTTFNINGGFRRVLAYIQMVIQRCQKLIIKMLWFKAYSISPVIHLQKTKKKVSKIFSMLIADGLWQLFSLLLGFSGSSADRESTCNEGDPGWIPGSGKSPGEGIGYPLQYP